MTDNERPAAERGSADGAAAARPGIPGFSLLCERAGRARFFFELLIASACLAACLAACDAAVRARNLESITLYLYKVVSGQICRSRDQLGSSAGVPVRQMVGPNPLTGPNNILELL